MPIFYFVVATFPLALYWIVLSSLHGGPRPVAIDGRRDFVALALGLSGVFFIGPGQAAAPFGALLVWRAWVWALCGSLAICVLILVSANLRPRVVVYNATKDRLRTELAALALSLDDEARWAGASLNLPGLGVQFYLEDAGVGRVVSLVGFGANGRSAQGWARFEKELTARLDKITEPRRLSFGRVLFAALGWTTLLADGLLVAYYYADFASAIRFYLAA